MKRLVIFMAGSLLALLLFAAPAQADFRITVDGITYEGVIAEKGMTYRVNGHAVAYSRKGKDKNYTEFVDVNGNLIGSAVYIKTGYNYFDKYGNPAGTVEVQDRSEPDVIYKDRFGNVIGYSQGVGCFRRNFLDANHNIIGAELGSNALPLRPIPLEIWLRMRK